MKKPKCTIEDLLKILEIAKEIYESCSENIKKLIKCGLVVQNSAAQACVAIWDSSESYVMETCMHCRPICIVLGC